MTNALAMQANDVSVETLYIEMVKRTLTDSIYWDDPLATYTLAQFAATGALWKRYGIRLLESMFKLFNLRLVRPYVTPIQDYARLSKNEIKIKLQTGNSWPLRAHTMIGLKRLDNLQFCVETVIKEGIAGDLIETGVWRGGACIFMRAILKAYGDTTRTVWVADSFAGLPPPNAGLYRPDAGDTHHTYNNFLGISRAEVEQNFLRYELLDEQVRFLEGWFKDTLPAAPIDRLSVLRLDGDMYESTIQALESLYEKLSCGGFLIVDDYFLKACRQAIVDFRAKHRIDDPIIDIDGVGAFWRKSSPGRYCTHVLGHA